MTPRYWTGIVVAMLVIFCAGMLVARGVDKAKGFVESTVSTFGYGNANFRVDGARVGSINRWQFMRSQAGQVDSAVLTINVNGDTNSFDADHCILRATGAQPFSNSTRFKCVSVHDSASLHLVRFGHVELLPDRRALPMYVAGERAEDTRLHAYKGAGSSDSGDVDITADEGSFSIKVNGKELVSASGDSSGGSLVIRDPKTGRPIVQISGDSNGGSVKVTDSNGKTRVDIHGAGPKRDTAH